MSVASLDLSRVRLCGMAIEPGSTTEVFAGGSGGF